jgi:hypothetical protein
MNHADTSAPASVEKVTPPAPIGRPSFRDELEALINSHSMENGSNTPDFMLADYLANCLDGFNHTINTRERWYGREPRLIGEVGADVPSVPPLPPDP